MMAEITTDIKLLTIFFKFSKHRHCSYYVITYFYFFINPNNMKTKITFMLILSAILVLQTRAQQWSGNLAAGKLAAGTVVDLHLDLYKDTIFIAFADKGSSDKANVMKFTGTQWVHVGSPNFTEGKAGNLQFAMDNGTPWVAFSDGAHGNKASVMRFDGNNWVHVGSPGISKFVATHLALRISGGTAYLAYSDAEFNDKATVVKSGGGSWSVVGSPGFTPGMSGVYSLAVSGSTPYLSFRDYANNYRASVMKFDGTAWVFVGQPGFTPATHDGYRYSLAVHGGVPYLAARGTDAKATVYKFEGSAWSPLGREGISTNSAFGLTLAFNSSGIPHVAFGDGNSTWKLSVMRYENNNWISMGDRFSSGSASYINLALKSDNTPVVGYNGIIVQQYSRLTTAPERMHDNALSLFPNPNAGQFSIRIPGSGNQKSRIEIWSSDGRLMDSFEADPDGQQVVYSKNLSRGTYFVKAVNENFRAVQKMVVR
jgi:hypothetical protein